MRRCVIAGGAPIEDYERIKGYLREDDYKVFCDCGLRHAEPLGVKPDLIVGDFDSHERPDTDIETIVLPVMKDDTDSLHAMSEAASRGYKDFLLIGMTGRRLDHTLGNIYMLVKAYNEGLDAVIVDDYSEISVVGEEAVHIGDDMPFFSLINITGTARGIYIENAKYPLNNAVINCDYQYGISNEVLLGKTATVRVEEGLLLLVKDVTG